MSGTEGSSVPPPNSRKVALLVQYDGTMFHGLQRQENNPRTVQEIIENALAALGIQNPGFIASGRTDAGVHAIGQVVTVYIDEKFPDRKIALAINSHLPPDVRITRAATCHPDFNPRFDARLRTYIYRLTDRRDLPPIYRNFVAPVRRPLDEALTISAAMAFQGKWELDQWRSSICQGTRTFLTISEANAYPPHVPDNFASESVPYWRLIFRARSFLHHQVRFMAGAVVAVGSGRLPLDELKSALSRGERPAIVKCESANGLCFTDVRFVSERDPFPTDGPQEVFPDDDHDSE